MSVGINTGVGGSGWNGVAVAVASAGGWYTGGVCVASACDTAAIGIPAGLEAAGLRPAQAVRSSVIRSRKIFFECGMGKL
jgi:hypothetical protein